MCPSDAFPAPGGPEPKLVELLSEVLATTPDSYGYPTYSGRFGWTVPSLRKCLAEQFGIRLTRPTMRRTLSNMGYVWKHKRFVRIS